VLDHDFPSWADGRGIPYGIYDVGRNAGYVAIGTTHETAAFAVAASRRWWLEVGRRCYAGAKRLLIQADGGGANGCRRWAWEGRPARVGGRVRGDHHGDALPARGLEVEPDRAPHVQLISENWAGEPLLSYEMMLKFIRRT
jgi:hypothetical protein